MRSTVQEDSTSHESQWYASQDPTQLPPTEAVRHAGRVFGEVREYLSFYLSAKADAWKASMRNIGVLAALGVLALGVALTIVCVSTALLCIGIAQALATAMGGRMWAGNLIVGGGLLVIIFGGAFLGSKMLASAARKRTIQKYELRQEQQRRQHGRTVAERAAAEGQVSE
jgi:hypothetical protein